MTEKDLELLKRMATCFMARGGERIPLFAELTPGIQRKVLDSTPHGKGLDVGALALLSA